MKKITPPKPRRFPRSKQLRMDELLNKSAEGTITEAEKSRLRQLVQEAEELMAANAQRLIEFANSEATQMPSQGVPVTVWVRPEPAES